MTHRCREAGVAMLVALLGAAAPASARPADVTIVSSVPLAATITNTVKVSSLPSAPTPIAISSLMSSGVAQTVLTLYSVPAGKDLIITSVSGYFAKFLGDNTALSPRFALLRLDGADAYMAPLVSQNQSFFNFADTVTMTARDNVGMNAYRDNTAGAAEVKFVVHGYLVSEGSAAASAAQRTSGPAPLSSPATTPPAG